MEDPARFADKSLSFEQRLFGNVNYVEEVIGAMSLPIHRLGLGPSTDLASDEAIARWGRASAVFSLGSNSRVRADKAKRDLGWAPVRKSVTDYILNDMQA